MLRILNTLLITVLIAQPSLGCSAPTNLFSFDQSEYARPHRLIDVGDGRKLNLFCSGLGSPTVIFESGAGAAGWDWVLVHSAVAQKTRACVYDRAGYGYSSPIRRPATNANAVDDLHRLLIGAGIVGPYVLVGHSLGASYVRLFTYRYPNEVSGLVLVDGAHEDQNARFVSASKGQFAKLLEQGKDSENHCVALFRKGVLAGSQEYRQCMGDTPQIFDLSLSSAYVLSYSQSGPWDAYASENQSLIASSDELRSVRKSFGDLPLICLTRGLHPGPVPGLSVQSVNAMEKEWVVMHKEVANLSSHGRQRTIAGSGHFIQRDKPQAVIDAINEVLVADSNRGSSQK